MSMPSSGQLIGVGTGPGDPELLTVKAVKALERADVVAYFAKQGRGGNGRAIVSEFQKADVTLLPLYYPVTTEIDKDAPESVSYTHLCVPAIDQALRYVPSGDPNAGRG